MLINLYQLADRLLVRLRQEDGQTMAEYAILMVVIALVVLGAAVFLGSSISSIFSSVASNV